jgi:benzoylformate decarboxylase
VHSQTLALEEATRPAFVAGPAVDVDGAVPDLVALAEKCRAGVWSSAMSPRSSFPEDHPLFQGFLAPEEAATADVLAAYDLVVVFGAPVFTYHVHRGGTARPLPPLYLISEDEQTLARASTGTGIRATLRLGIRALLDTVSPATRTPPAPMRRPPRPADELSAALVFAELADALPPDAILIEEAPSHTPARQHHLPIRARGLGLLRTASGTLGYGLPAAVGAALARPDRRVVAVVGDGSSMYCIQALWTAAQENVPVTFVILDNAEYAAVRGLAEAEGAKVPGAELGGIDFVSLATGLGCLAYPVEHAAELRPALATALAAERPTLLHIKVP